MHIQTFEKINKTVEVVKFTGGREQGLEICRWLGASSAYRPATNEDPREYLEVPTMFGPRDIKVGQFIVKVGPQDYLTYKAEALFAEYAEVLDNDHPLVKHARRELEMFPGEDIEFKESLVAAVKGFTAYRGHSGSSAEIARHMITALLNGQNLLPLTDDPEEWEFRAGVDYGIEDDYWQNIRNSAALSQDGGKTYFIVNEPSEYEEDRCSVPGHPKGRFEEGDDEFYCPSCEASYPLVKLQKLYESEPKNKVIEIDPEDLKSDEEKTDGTDLS